MAADEFLIPVDGSLLAESALPYAQALAGERGTLSLLRVVPPAGSAQSVGEDEREIAERELNDLSESLRSRIHRDEITIRSLLMTGDPATEILRAAEQNAVSAIVMTSQARGALGRATFGSVADRVAHNARVPVVIVRPTDNPGTLGVPATIRRVIVPLDGSKLADQAITFARQIAMRLNVPISLVHVIDTVSTYAITGTLPLPQSAFDEWLSEARAMLQPAANFLEASGVAVSIEVLQGAPFAAISNYATPNDLIVMSSHGRTGFTRWLLGSVAEKLVRSAPAPVCVVPMRD